MDDILIKIEDKNCEIEQLLEQNFELSLDDVSNINKLYLEKKELIGSFITQRTQTANIDLVNSDKQYWQSKFDKYLSKDREVLNKLDKKVQSLAVALKQSQSNKKLLIYKER